MITLHELVFSESALSFLELSNIAFIFFCIASDLFCLASDYFFHHGQLLQSRDPLLGLAKSLIRLTVFRSTLYLRMARIMMVSDLVFQDK